MFSGLWAFRNLLGWARLFLATNQSRLTLNIHFTRTFLVHSPRFTPEFRYDSRIFSAKTFSPAPTWSPAPRRAVHICRCAKAFSLADWFNSFSQLIYPIRPNKNITRTRVRQSINSFAFPFRVLFVSKMMKRVWNKNFSHSQLMRVLKNRAYDRAYFRFISRSFITENQFIHFIDSTKSLLWSRSVWRRALQVTECLFCC